MIWTASLAANIGTWMYTAASSWLMTSLSPDPLIVSLVQVAASLPIFLLAIPAGALADIIDRRRFLIIGEAANTAIAVVFAVLVSLNLVTAAVPQHLSNWIRAARAGIALPLEQSGECGEAGGVDFVPVVVAQTRKAAHAEALSCIEIVAGSLVVRIPLSAEARTLEAILRVLRRG